MNDQIEIDITQNKLNVDTNDKINVVVHKTDLTNYYTKAESDLKFLSKEEAQNTYATISSVDELSNIINSNRENIGSIQSKINVMQESLVNVKSSADEAKNKAQEAYNLALEIDGSPKGVYANLSALQTAFPSGASGVYITEDDGYWNYWNGTEWKKGAVYLSSEDIKQLKEDLVNIDNALSYKKTVGFDSVENGKIYSRNEKNGVSFEGYNSYHKNVDENKVYYISTTVPKENKFSAVLFYGNDGYIGSAGDYETVGSSMITDYEFKTPIGTTEIIVTIANWVTRPTLKEKEYIDTKDINVNKFAKNFVKVEDGVVSVKSKYNSSEDICFVFKQRGGNNLVDFDKVYTVQNNSYLNEDFTKLRTLFNNSTDFFSPHIVSADSNRDGDNINSYYFTGGNHKTTNTDVGGGVTANTTSFNIYADEMSVPQNGCYCNKVVLDWINEIQAFNTSKADGSGRAVLEEHITLSIVGNKINCKITHKAKEPIKRSVYYGLQALTNTYNTVRFIGGTNRKLCPTVSDETQKSGGTTCRDIQIASTSGDIINVHIYDTDLGDFSNCEKSFSAFNSGYGKSYFNVIRHEETPAFVMDTGDMTEICGYYEFASTN